MVPQTHLWESYSNGKDADGKNLVGPNDAAFNQRVRMFLKGQAVTNPLPNGYKDYIAPTGDGIDANLFNNGRSDQTTIYIYTPYDRSKPGQVLKYDARYGPNGEVKDTIGEILGNNRPKIVMLPYTPLDTGDPVEREQLGTNSRGCVLFQYDPNSDGNGKRAWRLFAEKGYFTKAIT